MNRVHILVEGPTEETFVDTVLNPHLASWAIELNPILVGGHTKYAVFRKIAQSLLNDSKALLVTTMLDYYGLPQDFPGQITLPAGNCYTQVQYLEQAIFSDIGDRRFLPYLSLHEFEAILFSDPEKIVQVLPDLKGSKRRKIGQQLARIRQQFAPEEIDDNPQTAPSKRLLSLIPEYRKTIDGPAVARHIGLERIRNECPHFNQWLTRLEGLGP